MAELQLACPSCRHPNRKYYFNPDKNLGYCFHCGYSAMPHPLGDSGSDTGGPQTSIIAPGASFETPAISVLNQSYIRASQVNLVRNQGALHYLMNDRALKLEAIKYFQLGYESERHAIVIPHTDSDRKVCGIKYRHINPDITPKYVYAQGSRSGLYNIPVLLSTKFPWCIITEGEFDCISLYQLASQLPVVGLPGMNTFKDRWLKWFERFERIYIAFDREEAADERAEALAKTLKDYRCYRVKLPEGVKDINELVKLKTHTEALNVWRVLMQEAKCIGIPLIKETKEYTQEVKDFYFGAGVEAISTGFPALDLVTGGLMPGRVYLLRGNTGLGKTTFALHLLVNVARNGGKCLIGSFEMKVGQEMILKIASKLLGFDLAVRNNNKPLTPGQLSKVLESLCSFLPLSWINRHDRLRMGELYDAVKIKYAEGYRFLLLDHAQFMMNLGKEDAVYSETAKISRFIKRLTNDFPELVILLITELNSQEGTFGGKSLEYDSDVVLSYYGTGLEVQKHRVDSSLRGRKVQIRWDREKCSYAVF